MDQFIKVAGTEGKVGGYFCRLPPLNENTEYTPKSHPSEQISHAFSDHQDFILLVRTVTIFPKNNFLQFVHREK